MGQQVFFLHSSTWNGRSLWFGYPSLVTFKQERTPYIFINTTYYSKFPLLYCIAESSESTGFPCSLYLYKAYNARKVFNQPNNLRSSQEQVISLIWLNMHVCAGKIEWVKNSTGILLHKECHSGQLTLQRNLFSTSKQWEHWGGAARKLQVMDILYRSIKISKD